MRKSQSQPTNVTVFSGVLFTHFSVNKLRRLSKLIDWNSHIALKAAITLQCDADSVIWNIAENRNIKGILYLLMLHINKVGAMGFLNRIAGRLHRPERIYRRFFVKRQSLKARKHETKRIFDDFNVRQHSHKRMDTNFGRFRMLALRTMADEELKDDVNNATSFFKRRSMTFCMCVGLYDLNQHCIERLDCRDRA